MIKSSLVSYMRNVLLTNLKMEQFTQVNGTGKLIREKEEVLRYGLMDHVMRGTG